MQGFKFQKQTYEDREQQGYKILEGMTRVARMEGIKQYALLYETLT